MPEPETSADATLPADMPDRRPGVRVRGIGTLRRVDPGRTAALLLLLVAGCLPASLLAAPLHKESQRAIGRFVQTEERLAPTEAPGVASTDLLPWQLGVMSLRPDAAAADAAHPVQPQRRHVDAWPHRVGVRRPVERPVVGLSWPNAMRPRLQRGAAAWHPWAAGLTPRLEAIERYRYLAVMDSFGRAGSLGGMTGDADAGAGVSATGRLQAARQALDGGVAVEAAGLASPQGQLDPQVSVPTQRRWVELIVIALAAVLALYAVRRAYKVLRSERSAAAADAQHMAEQAFELPTPADPHGGAAAAPVSAPGAALPSDGLAWAADVAESLSQVSLRLAQDAAQVPLRGTEIRMATDEIARRTIVTCGLLDASTKEVERAVADASAIQDEMGHTMKVMAGLRARLLSLSSKVHAISRAALRAEHRAAASDDAPHTLHEVIGISDNELEECHRLTERIADAERAIERRIEALQRAFESVLRHAERGMSESQQVMALTRQVGSSLGRGVESVEQVTQGSQQLRAQTESLRDSICRHLRS